MLQSTDDYIEVPQIYINKISGKWLIQRLMLSFLQFFMFPVKLALKRQATLKNYREVSWAGKDDNSRTILRADALKHAGVE